MGYGYNRDTGLKHEISNGHFETVEGWCPLYNIHGKYVGSADGIKWNGAPEYYKPSTQMIVSKYEDLDW